MRPTLALLAAAALLLSCKREAPSVPAGERVDGGRMGSLAFFQPDTAPQSLVFLFSDASGWDAELDRAAGALRDDGTAVLGVDLPSYEKGLRESDDGCHYLLSEIEALSQQVQRKIGGSTYRSPILAGIGEGGTLAYAALAQAPSATVAGAVSVDPAPALVTRVALCPGAPSKPAPGKGKGFTYGAKADLPGWWIVSARTPLPPELAALAAPVEEPPPTDAPPADRLVTLLSDQIASGETSPALRDLPLTEIPAADKPGPWMAIVYSGDGGWRDLDKEIGEWLAEHGAPVVGVDSLRYFWSEKKPDDIARDLAAIIDAYGDRWGTQKVVLVGYSFGASILPFAVNRLPDALRSRVVLVSLLGLEARASFQIEVEGWLGAEADRDAPLVLPELLKIDKSKIQCVYGEEEDDSLCPDPQLAGAEIVRTEGGHHFDGDYAALAQRIFDAAQARTVAATADAKAKK